MFERVCLSSMHFLCFVLSRHNICHSQACWVKGPKLLSAGKRKVSVWLPSSPSALAKVIQERLANVLKHHCPSWSEHHSLPSALVSNPFLCLQAILFSNTSKLTTIISPSGFLHINTIKQQSPLSLRSCVYSKHTDDYDHLSAVTWNSLCLTLSAPPVVPMLGQA